MIGKLLAALLLLPAPAAAAPAIAADSPYDVLVFSRTAGFRHDAIPTGIQTIRDLGAAPHPVADRDGDATLGCEEFEG